MLNEQINSMIMTAMKSGQHDVVEVYRAIKNEFLKFSTAKNAGVLDEAQEVQILRKMEKERLESAVIYTQNNRTELAEKEKREADIVHALLPEPVDQETIRKYLDELYPDGISQKEMGLAIKKVKEKYPSASGQDASAVAKTLIK